MFFEGQDVGIEAAEEEPSIIFESCDLGQVV